MLHWFSKRLREVHERNASGERGFTLIELLVVVIIIGILAAIAIPIFLNQRGTAQENAAKAQLRNAATAQSSYYAQNNAFTTTVSDLDDFGFPTSGTPAVTIDATATDADSFCMSATANSKTFVTKDTATTPVVGTC